MRCAEPARALTSVRALRRVLPVRGHASAESAAAYLFLLPWLTGLVMLTIGPMFASLWVSFTRYDLVSAPTWVGLQNYVDLPVDSR